MAGLIGDAAAGTFANQLQSRTGMNLAGLVQEDNQNPPPPPQAPEAPQQSFLNDVGYNLPGIAGMATDLFGGRDFRERKKNYLTRDNFM